MNKEKYFKEFEFKTIGKKMNNLAIATMNLTNETNVGGLIRTINTANINQSLLLKK